MGVFAKLGYPMSMSELELFSNDLSSVSMAEFEAKALALTVGDGLSSLGPPVRALFPVMLQLVTRAPLNFAELVSTDVYMFRKGLGQVLILEVLGMM